MVHVLHLTELSRWHSDGSDGPDGSDGAGDGDVEAESLHTQGFLHASADEPTLLAVANALYSSATEPLVVLVVETDAVDAEVLWEAADPAPPPGVSGDVLFPHIYGPIPRKAVVGVRHPRRDAAGRFTAFEERPRTAEVLDLLPHPEGGWYRQTWRSGVELRPDRPDYPGGPNHPDRSDRPDNPDSRPGTRATATGIHFLLTPGEESRWHRVRSDEVWVFNRGGPLRLEFGGTGAVPEPGGRAPAPTGQVPAPAGQAPEPGDVRVLGPGIEDGQHLQVLVPAHTWQRARPLDAGSESLVSCFVSPGFDFADFEVAPD
ncbi:cupin domain-containing protein [Nocardiopsis sp. HNM0947]|uniref:Cupin domain-containing protein n=1 Tax=Nocardiopsis coralli TaxID=2772213 RepID=A0ABR9P8I5_9ACTN|nr:cupin domain-containing protein [Nocardiopsis coralli]MBE3000148.1 cupin domain-containing protein [Nocardiopsis coralli]